MSSLLCYTQVLLSVCFAIACADATAGGSSQSDKKLPNIVFLLIDDFGWADASWHREKGYSEVQTPHMQELVESGIELDRNYVYKFCSPTRSSIQSGRNPIHVNAQNVDMMSFDPANPLTGVSGIAVNMTGFAQRMAEAGYKHRIFAGKADFGMAHHKQTPMGRGYTDALFYFNHMNDYWSQNVGKCGELWMRDLFGTNPDGSSGPQHHLLNPEHCWVQNMSDAEAATPAFPKNMSGCVYEEDLFTDFTVRHIMEHDPNSGPMLAFHSAHSIHTPLEIVPDAYEKFDFIEWDDRRRYHAMVWNVDRAVGRIVHALKTKGLYENTLIVLSADNGGPIYMKGTGGGNNYPLKGGKAGNWEGGVRVNGFVSGGFVPQAMRGQKLAGLVTGWDWYATFVHGIAGLDATDVEAAGAGLPPIDSIDQWAYLSGATDIPPRTEIPMGTTRDPRDIWARTSNHIEVHALIKQDPHDKNKLWKLLVGQESQAVWTGPMFPNATTKQLPATETVFEDCGLEVGCLFDITSDPTEHHNVAAEHPGVVQELRRSLSAHNATVFAPARPNANAKACAAALSIYKDPRYEFGWWGPFADKMIEIVV